MKFVGPAAAAMAWMLQDVCRTLRSETGMSQSDVFAGLAMALIIESPTLTHDERADFLQALDSTRPRREGEAIQ